MTTRLVRDESSLESRPDYWKCQVVRDLEKIVYVVKIVEAVRPAENVDGS